ncbi:hypothetical protein OCT63_18895 [Vibrio sp. RW]|uniref:hypothetical protein n=1 Tax=Vibrio sp. RW TaxID=2998833 RepID=UPI0022CD8AC8|nr:hypothetical protein [Vibrio sp. RW]MDA0146295.1 hypothetical protein [Vibrio sp. RW]
MNFKIQAQNVRFGKTTLDRYLFFGHDGFKFCLRTLNRDLKSGKWEGPGRPHALVFFVTEEVNLKAKYIYFDGISYGYRHTNTKKALETKGPYLIALSVTHEEHEEANAKLKPTSLYIQPIASKTNIFPIESDLERHFFTHIAKEIDERSLQKWSIQKVLLPKAALLSETASPDYLLQQKNRDNKVAYRCLINIRNDTNDKSYREPVSLDIWRANERITLDGDDIKAEVSRIFQS